MFQYLSNKISSGENEMSKTMTGADGKEYLIEPEANLSGADLSGAELEGAELVKILTVNSN